MAKGSTGGVQFELMTGFQRSASGICSRSGSIFVNDLKVDTTSRTLKFADDTKLFLTAADQTYHLML